MSTRAALAALFSIALPLIASAQNELMPEAGQIGLSVQARITASMDSKLKQSGIAYDDIDTSTAEISATQTIRLEKGHALRIGIERQRTSIDQRLSAGDPVMPLPEELNSASASISYTHVYSPQWIFSGRVGVGSHVTDTGLLSDGLATSASAIAIYNRSRTTTYVFGLAYTSNLEDLRVLPVFGFNWRPTPKWSFAFGFPKTGATYHVSKALTLGLAFSGDGGSYYVEKDPLPGAAPRSLADSKLQQRELRLGFDASWKINPTIRLSGSIGETLYRKFKYIDRDFELKSDNFAPFITVGGIIAF